MTTKFIRYFIVGMTVVFAIIMMVMASHFELLYIFNPVMNIVLPNKVDKSCNIDSDCVLDIPSLISNCSPCDPYGCKTYSASSDSVVAINKDWLPRCTFKSPENAACLMCIGGIDIEGYGVKCINNECKKVRISDLE